MSNTSILSHILQRADKLAQQRDAENEHISQASGIRGGESPFGIPDLEHAATTTAARLHAVTAQVNQVSKWLQEYPDVFQILDTAIHDEVKQMEKRVNRMNVVMNAFFTIIGAFIGLFLPTFVTYIAALVK